MKIVSRFKDYYDFVGQRYGQDPDIRYERKNFRSDGYGSFSVTVSDAEPFEAHMFSGLRRNKDPLPAYRTQYLVAGTRLFPIFWRTKAGATFQDDRPAYQEQMSSLEEFRAEYQEELDGRWNAWHPLDRRRLYKPNADIPELLLEELICKVGAPVFMVHGRMGTSKFGVAIASEVPHLADYGIPAIVPPAQMWQNIYSCLLNVLRDNPDNDPPVQLGERDRIVKAGFDIKTSFRGKPPK